MLAPVALFVYNRPEHTLRTLEALAKNGLAEESHLFIFADGPKVAMNASEFEGLRRVRELIKEKKWCSEVTIKCADNNLGLAKSIISGVSEVIAKYGKIIVLEDDIVTSPGFLTYMNNALEFYQDNKDVMHISGYMYPHTEKLPETLFYNVPLCWGWATWARSWDNFISDTSYLFNHFEHRIGWKGFDKFGGKQLSNQLRANYSGNINTWFVKWHASVLLKNGYCLFPGQSLVNNIGFDNSGIHCDETTAFSHPLLAEGIKIEKIPFLESAKAGSIIKKFYAKVYPERKKSIWKKINPVKFVKSSAIKLINKIFPGFTELRNSSIAWKFIKNENSNINKGEFVKIYEPSHMHYVDIGDYSYISQNAYISHTSIGKFCSIGPNLLCGWGVHPINGISTAPMFYSKHKQNGITLSDESKIVERGQITIGNDVFIGANVTILDGVSIGDGAVIGAGAVVSKDIPAYAVAVGSPIKIIKYRFEQELIEKLIKTEWWNFNFDQLKDVEKDFFDIEKFLKKYGRD